MFRHNNGFAGFSVDDISAAKQYYEDTLGLEVTEQNGTLSVQLGGGAHVFIYAKGPRMSRLASQCSTSPWTTSTPRSPR